MCQKYKSQLLNRWFENHFSESRTIHKQSTDQHCRSIGWYQYDTNLSSRDFSMYFVVLLFIDISAVTLKSKSHRPKKIVLFASRKAS